MQEQPSPQTARDAESAATDAPNTVPVIGIGASAGGLDAFVRLLKALPPDTGHAFVLVQHLDATHPSSLSDILARATSMPVFEATDGVPVGPDQVFVIPPNTELTITARVLRLSPRPQSPGGHYPIDRFLTSLAADCGSQCAGVILSGTGSDGTDGLSAIRAAGGVTYAQAPSTAEFPSMPTMAAAAGGVDFVLSPEQIAEALTRLTLLPGFTTPHPATEVAPPDASEDAEHMRAICDAMYESTGIDFSLYRETTVARRVLRRRMLRGLPDLRAYAALLADDQDERGALQRDLLIGVTSFFRDPASFEALTTLVFPTLFKNRSPDTQVRVWVPGCATGEEAYSILIALHEYQREHGTSFPLQVFASDINDAALDTARIGRYPASIVADVKPERLHEYFTEAGGEYQIAQQLREQCVFSRHNLIDDPPFSKLDLISCRNVLIYLESVQKQIIPLFHYALLDHGFLMLGRSETAHFTDLFQAVEPRLRIYAKRHVARRPYGFAGRRSMATRGGDGRLVAPVPQALAGRDGRDLGRQADRILLSTYSPPGVLVDDNLNVLEIRGQAVPFLALPTGKLSFRLLKLIPDTGLFLAVEELVKTAVSTGEPARLEHVQYDADGRHGEVTVEVRPLAGTDRRASLILFEDATATARRASSAPGRDTALDATASDKDRQIERLTRELHAARERLITLVEEHDTTDQETQQVAEDALSTNEELQSLSEELETAKEELQSTNEELITVNRDLEARNLTLISAQEVARSTVETVSVPLVVLDHSLTVRSVNAAFSKAFGILSPNAQGVALFALADGAWDVPELREALERLRTARRSFEAVSVVHAFPSVGERAMLIGGAPLGALDMLLLTVDDVTERRQAEAALKHSETRRGEAERMETVGRLAGGVAHDFNNLLTVIIGYCGLLTETLAHDDEAADQVEQIRVSAERAATLTDQLLAFSRRKVLQPKAFDLNLMLVEFERMIRRLLGKDIRTVVRVAPNLAWVQADPGEIGRVLMNLCLNARDAMPAGGVLTLETSSTIVDEARGHHLDLPPGRYTQLSVCDTGYGMSDEMRSRVFEPFFTTKDSHTGRGLGLASVFGIVRQSGGAVWCTSHVGRGTEFIVLLPEAAVVPAAAVPVPRGPVHAPEGSTEVVLLVDDEDGVRGLARRILEASGYIVIEASDGREALDVLETQATHIDILVSDVILPGLDGRALVDKAAALRPDLKVLFMSGHTPQSMEGDGEGELRRRPFLQKPFAPHHLARTVRDVLDSTYDGGTLL